MNEFPSVAASAPRIGLIELPDLAVLLERCGLNVVTGADFRSAATEIRNAFTQQPFPVIVGETPREGRDTLTPGLRAWVDRLVAVQKDALKVAVVRNPANPVIVTDGIIVLEGPLTVNTILAAVGLAPLAGPDGNLAYPEVAEAAPGMGFELPDLDMDFEFEELTAPPAPQPVVQAPAAAPLVEDDFAAPAPRRLVQADDPFGEPAPRVAPVQEDPFAAPAPAAPAPAQAEPVMAESPRRAARRAAEQAQAPAAPADDDFYGAEPVTVQEPVRVEQVFPVEAPAPVQQFPSADDFFDAPAQQAPVLDLPDMDFYDAAPAPVVQPVSVFPQPVQQEFHSTPAPVVQQPAAFPPAQDDFYEAPVAPVFEAPVFPVQEFQAPAPVAPVQRVEPIQPVRAVAPAAAAEHDAAAGFEDAAPLNTWTPTLVQGFGEESQAAGAFGQLDQASDVFDDYEVPDFQGTANRTAGGLGAFVINFSGKGGVGKSTTTLQMAKCAADAGLRVIVIDGNSGQGDLRTYLKLQKSDLPTIYDAVVNSVKTAILTPEVINARRDESLGEIKFAFVSAPPDNADFSRVTDDLYAEVITFARRNADLVIMDTQIVEASDRTDVVKNLILPALVHDAWGVGISDMTSVGVNNLNGRLQSFIKNGVPEDRLMAMLNRVAPEALEANQNVDRYFHGRATFLGTVEDLYEVKENMNAGRIEVENPQLERAMAKALLRITGREIFRAGAEQVEEPETSGGGLFSRLLGRKRA